MATCKEKVLVNSLVGFATQIASTVVYYHAAKKPTWYEAAGIFIATGIASVYAMNKAINPLEACKDVE